MVFTISRYSQWLNTLTIYYSNGKSSIILYSYMLENQIKFTVKLNVEKYLSIVQNWVFFLIYLHIIKGYIHIYVYLFIHYKCTY